MNFKKIFTASLTLWAGLSGMAQKADTNPAMNDPSRFAWNLFTTFNRPGDSPATVVWQNWIQDAVLYKNPCEAPAWPDSPGPPVLDTSALLRLVNRQFAFQSQFSSDGLEQTYYNRVLYQYIVDKDLYYSEGVLARAAADDIDVPLHSAVLKVNWTPISEDQKDRYYWHEFAGRGLYGINAFHIVTKDLPDWFWSTFEQVDNRGRCDTIGCTDDFGSVPAYIAPHVEPNLAYAPGHFTDELMVLFDKAGLDPVWRHYRLKGTQTVFTDASGRPTLLANSVLEPNFAATSSCMTCHTRATVSTNTTGFSSSLGAVTSMTPLSGPVGAPDPSWFATLQPGPPLRSAAIVYRTEFLWGLTGTSSRADCGAAKRD